MRRAITLTTLLFACRAETAEAPPGVEAAVDAAGEVETSVLETSAAETSPEGGDAAADAVDACSSTPPTVPCCEGTLHTTPSYKCPTCAYVTRDHAECRSGTWVWAVNDDCWFACPKPDAAAD